MTDQIQFPAEAPPPPAATPRPRRTRNLVIAGVAGGAILVGGGAYALATGVQSAPSAAAAYGYGPGGYGPGGTGTPTGTPPAHDPHLAGTVTSASGSTVKIKDFDGFTRTINVTSATTYGDGLKAPLAVDTKILATGTVNADGTSLDATKIVAMPDRGAGGPGGWGGPGRGGPGGHGPGGTPPTGAPTGTPTPPSGAPTPPSGTASPSASPTGS